MGKLRVLLYFTSIVSGVQRHRSVQDITLDAVSWKNRFIHLFLCFYNFLIIADFFFRKIERLAEWLALDLLLWWCFFRTSLYSYFVSLGMISYMGLLPLASAFPLLQQNLRIKSYGGRIVEFVFYLSLRYFTHGFHLLIVLL